MIDPDPPAPWLRADMLRALPPGAGPWGYARAAKGQPLEYVNVSDSGELAARVGESATILFAWGPRDRHLRPVHEIGEIAGAVEARGSRAAREARRRSLPPFAATLLLAGGMVAFWPQDRDTEALILFGAILLLIPLWRRGVEGLWDAVRSLRLLSREPGRWREAQARAIRFSVWSGQVVSRAAVALIATFVLAYLAMLWADPTAAVLRFGLVKPLVRQGQWWRLLSCAFLHANLVHLFFNSSAGLSLAHLARGLVDESRILLVFFVSAAAGSVASVVATPEGISVGASGGILGWGGLLFGLALTHSSLRETGLLSGMLRWVILLSLIGLAGANLIDNAAHAGGFLAGLAFGAWPGRRARRPLPHWSRPPRPLWIPALAVLAAAYAAMMWILLRMGMRG